MADWTLEAARQFAAICRRHGVRARAVTCRRRPSYAAIYRDPGADFDARYKAAGEEARAGGWDGYCLVVNAEKD